jgi:hypothetical protein
VASAIVKGTSKILANVCANKVLPQPVGPTNNILDLDSSTPLVFFDSWLNLYNGYELQLTKTSLAYVWPIT